MQVERALTGGSVLVGAKLHGVGVEHTGVNTEVCKFCGIVEFNAIYLVGFQLAAVNLVCDINCAGLARLHHDALSRLSRLVRRGHSTLGNGAKGAQDGGEEVRNAST